MELIVTCGLGRDSIAEILENYRGEASFRLIGEQGLQARFTVEASPDVDPVILAKQAIRETSVGKNLIFQLTMIP